MATTHLSKTAVYESLYLTSLATQQIIHHLERLKTANVLAPKPAELRKMATNQLRTEIAAAAVMNLTSEEMGDAYRQERASRAGKAFSKAPTEEAIHKK